MESSPRFRTTDSYGEDNSTYPYYNRSPAPAASLGPTKLRLMCSSGGHIVPRPHDKSLCYVGGETRMVVVDRHTTLLDLTRRLSKTLLRSSSSSTATSPAASSFTLKYQLPSEDLDSLITVTTDEDLENMIEEYERLNPSSRLRLFIFPTNPESVSSIGSFLENPTKSEDWFLNALNGTNSGFSDTSSVNCLLDLDDEISLPEKKDADQKNAIGTNLRGNNSGQDVHSIPDSPMMETTSSFGSASSIPSPAPVVVSGSPVSSAKAIQEHSDHFLNHHEKNDQGLPMAFLKQHQQLQKQSTGFDLASMDSILSNLTLTAQSSPVSQIQSSGYNSPATDPNDPPDQNPRIQILQQQLVQNSAYLSSMPATQSDSPRHQFHHQQPQFTPPLQYIHHHPSMAVPVTSYYQHHPHHQPINQQNFMYYIPFQQPQPSRADTPLVAAASNSQAAGKTELPAGISGATNSGGPQLVRVPSGYQNQRQHVGYSEIHQPTQSIYYATPLSTAQYQNMTSISPVEANLQEQQVRTAQL